MSWFGGSPAAGLPPTPSDDTSTAIQDLCWFEIAQSPKKQERGMENFHLGIT